MAPSHWYPSVDDVIAIHDEIVSEANDTSPGIQSKGDVEFAIEFVDGEHLPSGPVSIHSKAYHLLRLLVANHPFVDGNKRTALNTVSVFYFFNGYRFEYDDEIRTILREIATDEAAVEESEVIDYLESQTRRFDLDEAIEEWRDDLIRHGLDRLDDDPNG